MIGLVMAETAITSSRRRVLEAVKRHEPCAAGHLAKALKMTDVAVRQHLAALEDNGLVEQREDAPSPEAGRGRPALQWRTTDLARSILPDRHNDLAVELIKATRRSLGEEGVKRIVEVRARDQVNLYTTLLPGKSASLKSRVEALTKQRTAEGYMAEFVQEKPGSYLLIEHHCPICDAAESCQGLCASELEVFRRTLGPDATIERTEHLLSGGRRCVYRITSAKRERG